MTLGNPASDGGFFMNISKRFFRIGTVILLLSLTLSGCSGRTARRLFMDETERYEDAHTSPFFWDNATPIDGYSNLYELTPFSFTGKPYNNVTNFGDHLLVIGEGYSAVDSSDINYYFTVYDPWENRITASLSPDEVSCTDYQTAGDYLLLFDSGSSTMSVYDTSLKLLHTYDTASLPIDGNTRFFAASGSDCLYATDTNNTFLRLDLSGDTLQADWPSLPCFENMMTLWGLSSDNRSLMLSGVSKTSLKYVTLLLSPDDLTTVREYTGLSYYTAGANENTLLAETNYQKSGWIYTSVGNDPVYFSLPDFQNMRLLPDGQILVEQISGTTNGENSQASFSVYDSTGTCQSSFTYDLGVYGSPDALYLSAQGAYLESCNCYFLILYDVNCNPSFLVWDLGEHGNSPSNALTIYADEESFEAATADTISPDEESSELPEDYGSEVSAIPEDGSYDWGALTEAHEYAESLEQQFGIEIYIGPEVPEKIDVFDVKQMKKSSQIMDSLSMLAEILADYPSNFFEQLCYGDLEGVRIYLTGTIGGSQEGTISDPSGFVNNINNHTVMVLDTNYNWDWNYTVNHELSHMIDRRLDFYHSCNPSSVYSEENWNSYNPDDFTYLDSYDDYEDNQSYRRNSEYFIDSYGTTYATEDRAEIFGNAMSDYLDGFSDDYQLTADSPVWYKMNYYASAIRDGFDTTGWPDVLPWEYVLQ